MYKKIKASIKPLFAEDLETYKKVKAEIKKVLAGKKQKKIEIPKDATKAFKKLAQIFNKTDSDKYPSAKSINKFLEFKTDIISVNFDPKDFVEWHEEGFDGSSQQDIMLFKKVAKKEWGWTVTKIISISGGYWNDALVIFKADKTYSINSLVESDNYRMIGDILGAHSAKDFGIKKEDYEIILSFFYNML